MNDYFKKNQDQALQDFYKFLSFHSVSTDPKYKSEVLACADWLSSKIKEIGFDVEVWTTQGHPTLFATNLKAGPNKPTLLIYNHYDVQPVDPENEWHSSPFQPTLKNGEVYARGAQDNKGQCFYVLLALKALRELGDLPINVKWIIEGEEECGSMGLSELLKDKLRQEQLKADYLAIVDMGIPNKNTPAITLGVRGLVTMEIKLTGSSSDLHSGSHGGIVYNPLHALVEILSKLRNADGKIAVPGFYDDVQPLSDEAKQLIDFAFDEVEYAQLFNAKATGGEKEFTPLERAWVRPTLEINGLSGGYGGPGFKTVLPAKAVAKVSCRLVPDQDPLKIGHLVSETIKKLAPPGVNIQIEIYPGKGEACRANPNSKIVAAFSRAYSELFNAPCKKIFDGGTIPIATQLCKASGSEVILVGLGLPSDQIHAPDEHFGVDRLEKGTQIILRTLQILGEN